MKFIYLTIIVVVTILFALSEVDAHKKHKHHGGHHDVHHHHHHYYHSGHHGHGWGHRYKREVIDIVKTDSLGPLMDKLMDNIKVAEGKTEALLVESVPGEKKPLNSVVAKDAAKEITKETVTEVVKESKVNEKVQNVASFAL